MINGLKIILFTIGFLAVIESLIILAFPKKIVKAGKNWLKNTKKIKKAALIELIIAVLLIFLAVLI